MSSSIDEGKMLLTLSLVAVSSTDTLTSFSESAMICSSKKEDKRKGLCCERHLGVGSRQPQSWAPKHGVKERMSRNGIKMDGGVNM